MCYQKQLWGVLQYLVVSVLWEITVGYLAYGILHVTEYAFPDKLSRDGSPWLYYEQVCP